MNRKLLIATIITIIISLFTFSYTFAAGNVVDGIRNFVGGAENVVEDAGNTVASGVKNGMNTIGNGARNVGNTIENGARDLGNTVENGARDTENTVGAMVTDNNNGGGYTATRTATDTNAMGGMNTNGWTWFIIGVTIVAVGVLIWSYIRENKISNPYLDSEDDY